MVTSPPKRADEEPGGPETVAKTLLDVLLPTVLSAMIVGLNQWIAPAGVRPWAVVVAGALALLVIGLVLGRLRHKLPAFLRPRAARWLAMVALLALAAVVLRVGRNPDVTQAAQTSGAYRAAIRQTCADDRELERNLQDDLGQLQAQLSGLPPPDKIIQFTINTLDQVAAAQRQERALLVRIEALTPPDENANDHAQLVSLWSEKLDSEDRFIRRTQTRLAAAQHDIGQLPAALNDMVTAAKASPDSGQEAAKDTLLIKLAGGNGCQPSA